MSTTLSLMLTNEYFMIFKSLIKFNRVAEKAPQSHCPLIFLFESIDIKLVNVGCATFNLERY